MFQTVFFYVDIIKQKLSYNRKNFRIQKLKRVLTNSSGDWCKVYNIKQINEDWNKKTGFTAFHTLLCCLHQ